VLYCKQCDNSIGLTLKCHNDYDDVLDDAIDQRLACSTNDREVGVRVLLATGSRIATVGQLLFAPRARVYSTLHPFRVGK